MERVYSSQFKGVVRDRNKTTRPWKAHIRVNGELHYLGYFDTEQEAAVAYQAAAAARVKKHRRRSISATGIYDDDPDRDWFEIELSQNKWAKVDLADMDLVIGYCWSLKGGYATRNEGERVIRMHRVILGLSDDDPREPDHKNRDRADNRRSNLRLGSHSENMANSVRKKRGVPGRTSRFRGVFLQMRGRRWRATITVNGDTRILGYFDTEEEAALAYNQAALEAFGEFATLNDV